MAGILRCRCGSQRGSCPSGSGRDVGPPEDRKWIVVDCGVLFGREATTPGVDVLMPDIRFLAERKDDVLAMVLTHAHEDHIGAIGYLWPMLRCARVPNPAQLRRVFVNLTSALAGSAWA